MAINKSELLDILEKITDLLEFKNENAFKISAFRNATNTIKNLTDDIETLLLNNELGNIKGIGKGILSVINEFHSTGKSSMLDELKEGIPDSLFELFSIHGLGVKKISTLFYQHKIEDISSLEDACKRDLISNIKGFGKKTQDKILVEIEKYKDSKKKALYNYALKIAEIVKDQLDNITGIEKIEISGEVRRVREIVSQIDFVVLCNDRFSPNSFAEFFNNPEINFNSSDEAGYIKLVEYRIPVFIHITFQNSGFNKTLFLTTGSKDYISAYWSGIESEQTDFGSEEELFRIKGIQYLPPELRETEHLFTDNTVIKSLSNIDDAKPLGMLHFHTEFSDGGYPLETMITKASEYGFEYFAVCDHSQTASYANGLRPERVLQQKEEIKRLQNLGFKVLHGVESDILSDGSLDYDRDFLPVFDFIVASVHSQFNLSEDEMTERIITAIENPFTDVIGHLTGRLLLYRDAYKLNVKKILDACSENNVAIEINTNPHRLDLDWRYYNYAREKNVLFALNQDAHSVDEIKNIEIGLKLAKKGAINKEEIINFLPYSEFIKFLNRKVKRNIN